MDYWTIDEKQVTGNVQYMIGRAGGLTTDANALLSSITTPISEPDGIVSITGLSPSSTSGAGIGAIFNLRLLTDGAGNFVLSSTLGNITATSGGIGYVAGDTITFTQADLIATGVPNIANVDGDLVITLQSDDIESGTLPTGRSTDELKVAGYIVNISFLAVLAGGSASLEGSLETTPVNWFTIPGALLTPPSAVNVNNLNCTIPVNFIRLTNNSGGNLTDISFSAEALIE